ncbi:LLM class flavin-dependent oxidoreductase [Phenylobacterium sp.]|uniref:LLM class flavin-dependent oxidoreductase n=1 Tax=Phenylobacterium sp. TaxID=1871053 RepID=UPI0025CC16E1|nr:LLM class flavin-dependent oxidoreductase [Phenylobacterium sp.]MCA3742108.1 LLM class flavin-dependent oxidoreductase [Phenylobacterium sp.]
MARTQFGAFLAPHHPIGEHPRLQFRNDIKFAVRLEELGFDEFWVGEHHSTGWEMIASPELFLAAVGEHTGRIRLGTGVISLPYHHPFNVAQRMVQLDYMTGGRVILGTGPGALPSDAHTLGIDPMTQRDRQDEAIGVIKRLLAGERVTHESEWFTLRDARLQLLPLQEEMEMVAASSVSPSGMTLAGKHGMGVLSIGSNSEAGLAALPTQWGFAEEAAAKSGKVIDRKNWRVLMSWHIAETREEARAQAAKGLMHWHNEYQVGTLMRPGAAPFISPEQALEQTVDVEGAAAVIGTPDDLVAAIRKLQASAGGFGVVLGFVHDWANRENTLRSWDLVGRYVIPEINGFLDGYRDSRAFVIENREWFDRAGQAVMSKIMSHEGAAAALKAGMEAGVAMRSPNAPDLNQAAKGLK